MSRPVLHALLGFFAVLLLIAAGLLAIGATEPHLVASVRIVRWTLAGVFGAGGLVLGIFVALWEDLDGY